MNNLKLRAKLIIGSGVATASMLLANLAHATTTTSTIDNIPSDMGEILDTIVQAVIATVISFLTNNLPLIIVLGVSIGLVFWLVRKARGATRGG